MMRTCVLALFFCFVGLSAIAQVAPSDQEPYSGSASYYAKKFQGRKTASGEIFRHDSLTAAHKTLPFGTIVKVTNRANGKSIVVRINDRMSPRARHLIDLTRRGARELDFITAGHTKVSLEVIPTLPVVDELQEQTNDSLPSPE